MKLLMDFLFHCAILSSCALSIICLGMVIINIIFDIKEWEENK